MNQTLTDPKLPSVAPAFPALCLLFSGEAGIRDAVPQSLSIGKTSIGRQPGRTGVALPEDPHVSRLHAYCTVDERGENLHLYDADSHNGTFVNGCRIAESPLSEGDVVRIGHSFLLVRREPPHRSDVDIAELGGSSAAMCALRCMLAEAAPSPAAVLVFGETGTGKELTARALHQRSGRHGPLVAVNCAAIPESLAESHFFGHIAGAFSGARPHDGFFRAADGGTLFLDEIGDLPLPLQPKLLRALEERIVTPVGTTRPIGCDVRIVAATHRDLRQASARGEFRLDLLNRLSAVVLALPPLRTRREDILRMLERAFLPDRPRLTARLVEALLLYDWPGNVREVFQLAEFLKLFRSRGVDFDLPLVVERLTPFETTPTVHTVLSAAEQPVVSGQQGRLDKELLIRLLSEHQGVIARVAVAAGRSRRQIRRLIEQFQLNRSGLTDEQRAVSQDGDDRRLSDR